jgi:hypothetical protein
MRRFVALMGSVAVLAACEDPPRPSATTTQATASTASAPVASAAVVASVAAVVASSAPSADAGTSARLPSAAVPLAAIGAVPAVASAGGPTASLGDVQRALGAKQNKEALGAARSLGLGATAGKLGAEELLTLASEARAEQAPRDAVVLLKGVRDRFPGSEQAGMASFDLGRVADDVDGKPALAAVHFEQYMKEQPQGPLLREALGRAMETRERMGSLDAARAHATRYLDTFPQGPHAKAARKLTAPPGVLK